MNLISDKLVRDVRVTTHSIVTLIVRPWSYSMQSCLNIDNIIYVPQSSNDKDKFR